MKLKPKAVLQYFLTAGVLCYFSVFLRGKCCGRPSCLSPTGGQSIQNSKDEITATLKNH